MKINNIKYSEESVRSFSNPLRWVAMLSIDVASLLQRLDAEDWVNKTLTSKMLHSRDVLVCVQLKKKNETKVPEYCFSYRQGANAIKIWFMQQSGFDENGAQTPKCMQTKSCCFISQLPPPFLPFTSPSSSLLPHFFISPPPFCYPLGTNGISTGSASGRRITGSGSRVRQTASGGSTEFTAPVWLGGGSCMNSCTGKLWHLCLPATQRWSPHRGLNFSLPLFHVTVKNCRSFAPKRTW